MNPEIQNILLLLIIGGLIQIETSNYSICINKGPLIYDVSHFGGRGVNHLLTGGRSGPYKSYILLTHPDRGGAQSS